MEDTGRARLARVRRVCVKVGTTTLTHMGGKLNLRRMDMLARALTDLRGRGAEVALVSSGAIAVGADRLGLSERPRDVRGKQAASAVGQAALIQIYEKFFMEYNQKVAQVLLTRDVFENETRRGHAGDTFAALFAMGVLPIVNENDAVSVDEIEFSDNDALSAYVARLVAADALIILSDIDGVYEADPRQNPGARRLSRIDDLDAPGISAGGSHGKLGTGGMATKLLAAKMARAAGIDTVIADGKEPAAILDILDGQDIGTWIPGVL